MKFIFKSIHIKIPFLMTFLLIFAMFIKIKNKYFMTFEKRYL